jgi:hypothetical protein
MKLVILVPTGSSRRNAGVSGQPAPADLCGEILVIDNGSRDDSVATRAADPSLRLIALPETSATGDNNVGLRWTKGRACSGPQQRHPRPQLSASPDAALDWFPNAAATTPRSIAPTGRRCSTSPSRMWTFNRYAVLARRERPAQRGFEERQEVPAVVAAACCSAPRRCAGSGSSTRTSSPTEDIDWSLRARGAGRCSSSPSRVFHARSGSTTPTSCRLGRRRLRTRPAQCRTGAVQSRRAYLGARNLMRLIQSHGAITRALPEPLPLRPAARIHRRAPRPKARCSSSSGAAALGVLRRARRSGGPGRRAQRPHAGSPMPAGCGTDGGCSTCARLGLR